MLLNFFILMEFSEPYQLLFQDTATPMMNGIIDLHHYIFLFLIAVLVFVLIILFLVIVNFLFKVDYVSFTFNTSKKRRKPFFFIRNPFFYDMYSKYFSHLDKFISFKNFTLNNDFFNNKEKVIVLKKIKFLNNNKKVNLFFVKNKKFVKNLPLNFLQYC